MLALRRVGNRVSDLDQMLRTIKQRVKGNVVQRAVRHKNQMPRLETRGYRLQSVRHKDLSNATAWPAPGES